MARSTLLGFGILGLIATCARSSRSAAKRMRRKADKLERRAERIEHRLAG